MENDEFMSVFLSDSRRYADLINGITCGGEQIVSAGDIREADTKGRPLKAARAGNGRAGIGQRTRDLVRKVAFGVNFAVIGVEDQETIDYSMSLRTLEYDAGEYERQAAKIRKNVRSLPDKSGLCSGEYLYGFRKSDRLSPVAEKSSRLGPTAMPAPLTRSLAKPSLTATTSTTANMVAN